MSEYSFVYPRLWEVPPAGPPPELHQRQVTSLLCEFAGPSSANPKIAILGAGLCQDIELPTLLKQFTKVQLVDLDRSALEQGVARQQVASVDHLELIAPYDLTGIATMLDDWKTESNAAKLTRPADEKNKLESIQQQLATHTWAPIDRELTVIGSTCLLSQLVLSVVETLGEHSSHFIEVIQQLRRQHLSLMIDHLKPGGTGVLIFDFLSSDTLHRLPHLSGEPLKRALQAAIDQSNFFHGMNPQVIYQVLSDQLSDQIGNIRATPPWVWNTSQRCYAVTALVFDKQ